MGERACRGVRVGVGQRADPGRSITIICMT